MVPADIVETFPDGRFRVAWGDVLPAPAKSLADFLALIPGGLLASALPAWWPRLYGRTKVNPVTGCWECPHNLSRGRYSHISIEGRMVQAHRMGYRTLQSLLDLPPLGDELDYDHRCRTTWCWYYGHAVPKTSQANQLAKTLDRRDLVQPPLWYREES